MQCGICHHGHPCELCHILGSLECADPMKYELQGRHYWIEITGVILSRCQSLQGLHLLLVLTDMDITAYVNSMLAVCVQICWDTCVRLL